SSSSPHLYLHSFPTRRSSDLSRFATGSPASLRPRIPTATRSVPSPATFTTRPEPTPLPTACAAGSVGPVTSSIRQPPPSPSAPIDRKSTRLNSSHLGISYAVF